MNPLPMAAAENGRAGRGWAQGSFPTCSPRRWIGLQTLGRNGIIHPAQHKGTVGSIQNGLSGDNEPDPRYSRTQNKPMGLNVVNAVTSDGKLNPIAAEQLALSEEEVKGVNNALKSLWDQMRKAASAHITKDESNSTETEDVYVISPYSAEAEPALNSFLNQTTKLLGPRKATLLDGALRSPSYFGNWGKNTCKFIFREPTNAED